MGVLLGFIEGSDYQEAQHQLLMLVDLRLALMSGCSQFSQGLKGAQVRAALSELPS